MYIRDRDLWKEIALYEDLVDTLRRDEKYLYER
jgi:hypothetical protein